MKKTSKNQNSSKNEKMRFLANSRNRQELMANTTDAERCCYNALTALGYRVIRQQPVYTGRKTFFLDLYIPKLRLAIECDGGYHYTDTQHRKDNNRSACLRRMGIHVYRLSNHDARDVGKVAAKIRQFLNNLKLSSDR